MSCAATPSLNTTGPPLEPLDLYRKKSGGELVGQIYTFTDRGEREVALRPEMTPTFARMVAARANALRKPVRWFSIPQLFRQEKQQRGRLREHFQLNADIVGEESVAADAELLAVALDVMSSFGLERTDVVARISDRRLLEALLRDAGVAESMLQDLYPIIDKRSREPANVYREKLNATVGSSDTADKVEAIFACRDVASLVERYGGCGGCSRACRENTSVSHLRRRTWIRRLGSARPFYRSRARILYRDRVRAIRHSGELRAICGGGRYDTLLATLGGVDLPALGFGMGDVVLGELLRSRNLIPAAETRVDYWVAFDDESLLEDVMMVAAQVRRRNRSAEYALRPQQLGRQLKTAAGIGAREAVLLKRERYALREVTVKHLDSGTERAMSLDEFLETLN
jgi:histidyl-tRNA synthetase